MFDPVMRATSIFKTIWFYLPSSVQSLFSLSVLLLIIAVLFRVFD